MNIMQLKTFSIVGEAGNPERLSIWGGDLPAVFGPGLRTGMVKRVVTIYLDGRSVLLPPKSGNRL